MSVVWCVGCMSPCAGKDADGFCLGADRAEIDARIARLRAEAVAAPAEASVEADATCAFIHRHSGKLGQYVVLLDGEPQEDVWCASIDVAPGSSVGFVQYGSGPTRRGRVEIVRKGQADDPVGAGAVATGRLGPGAEDSAVPVVGEQPVDVPRELQPASGRDLGAGVPAVAVAIETTPAAPAAAAEARRDVLLTVVEGDAYPETIPLIDKGTGRPSGWWRYEVVWNGRVLEHALRAQAGTGRRVVVWVPKPKAHRGPKDPDPLAGLELLVGTDKKPVEGASEGLLAQTAPGTVVIRRKSQPRRRWVPAETVGAERKAA